MERDIPSLKHVLILWGSLCSSVAVYAEEVVVISSARSPVSELSLLELRKIYFGLPVEVDGQVIQGIRNESSDELNRIFLQNVVAMSERNYNRRLLTLTVQTGRRRPQVVNEHAQLLARVMAGQSLISYVYLSTLTELDRKRLKIVRSIWTSE